MWLILMVVFVSAGALAVGPADDSVGEETSRVGTEPSAAVASPTATEVAREATGVEKPAPGESELECAVTTEASASDGATVACPFGAPSCFRDKQCDDFCGKGFGACEVFCCACTG